jgi:phage tail-like protein
MSCGPERAKFRLLDRFVGWDCDVAQDLVGFADEAGITLERIAAGALTTHALEPYLLPPRLARGCARCDWYLVTPAPARVLRRDACTPEWTTLRECACDPHLLVDPVAIAAHRHRLAVLDRGAREIFVWSHDGAQMVARIAAPQAASIAFAPWGELLVAAGAPARVQRFGPDGRARGVVAVPPDAGEPLRVAACDDCTMWLVTRGADGFARLWRAARGESRFVPADLAAFAKCFERTGVRVCANGGFCLDTEDGNGIVQSFCYSWYGRALEKCAKPAEPAIFETRGQVLTRAIDSGIPRCRWHRVRIEADVPPGTHLSIAVATSEEPGGAAAQGDAAADPEWRDYAAGVPHPLDWTHDATQSLDFLVEQPPGRYLYLRARFTGDGKASPALRRIRLDFPRATSLEFLPPVYRENPQAEDFTERFLALFDSSIGDLDRAIERFPALLDPEGVPDEVLPWLGQFLDVAFDPLWDAPRRRAILKALPRLYRERGTLAGMKTAMRLAFDLEPVIRELGPTRAWGALDRSARLGSVRLYGKAKSRIRLGASPLGRAPLKSYGNPDRDPLHAGAHRFEVLVAPGSLSGSTAVQRLQRLVDSQKPAHTMASVRVGGSGLVLGSWSSLGVDTSLGALSAPVLGGKGKGDGNVRLNRMSVLRPARRGARGGLAVGAIKLVGIHTVME